MERRYKNYNQIDTQYHRILNIISLQNTFYHTLSQDIQKNHHSNMLACQKNVIVILDRFLAGASPPENFLPAFQFFYRPLQRYVSSRTMHVGLHQIHFGTTY